MKDLSIVSILTVSLIFAVTTNFFVFSTSFKEPIASKTGHYNSTVGRLVKYI